MASSCTDSTSNYWFNEQLPQEDDIVLCTVTDTTDAGFIVTLDAYADREGFLPFSMMSSKRIRKNASTFLKVQDKHPVLVTGISVDDSNIVEVSLKDVSAVQKEKCQKVNAHILKLYNMCQRLEHVTKISKDRFYLTFKQILTQTLEAERENGDEGEEDLYEILHKLESLRNYDGLPEDMKKVLIENHSHLFGFTAHMEQKTFMIQCFRADGNEYVKQALLQACPAVEKEWTADDMVQDNERYNLSIKLIGLPKILVTVTAHDKAHASQVMARVVAKLQAAKFTIFMEV